METEGRARERDRLIEDEQRRVRRLRFLVDLTTNVLYQDAEMTLEEARRLVKGTEQAVLKLFPDKQNTFNLILLSRFDRIVRERWGVGLDPIVH